MFDPDRMGGDRNALLNLKIFFSLINVTKIKGKYHVKRFFLIIYFTYVYEVGMFNEIYVYAVQITFQKQLPSGV